MVNIKYYSSIRFKIILLFFILNLSTKIYSQKYKVTYSGSMSTDFCDPDPFISSATSVRISIGKTLFLEATCGNPANVVNATKEINFKPDKITAIVKYQPWLATTVTTKTDVIPLNLNQCDSWSGDYDSFPNTAGIGVDNFSFTIEPVIALIQPSIDPSCSVHISADNLGFSSDIYNWWYAASDNVWTLLPLAFQGVSNFDITLEDIFGLDAPQHYNQSIKFKIKYCQTETPTISFDYVRCSPELAVNPPKTDSTRCKNDPSGSVTLEFKTELKDGDKFLFNIWNADSIFTSKFVIKDSIKDNKYTWKGLAEGTYTMKYQAQSTINENTKVGLSAIKVNPFTIGSPAKLESTFEIPKKPLCHNDNGSITIKTTGGTGNYYYKINTDDLKQFDMTTTVDDISKIHWATQIIPLPSSERTDYKILITDEKSCIEKN